MEMYADFKHRLTLQIHAQKAGGAWEVTHNVLVSRSSHFSCDSLVLQAYCIFLISGGSNKKYGWLTMLSSLEHMLLTE